MSEIYHCVHKHAYAMLTGYDPIFTFTTHKQTEGLFKAIVDALLGFLGNITSEALKHMLTLVFEEFITCCREVGFSFHCKTLM